VFYSDSKLYVLFTNDFNILEVKVFDLSSFISNNQSTTVSEIDIGLEFTTFGNNTSYLEYSNAFIYVYDDLLYVLALNDLYVYNLVSEQEDIGWGIDDLKPSFVDNFIIEKAKFYDDYIYYTNGSFIGRCQLKGTVSDDDFFQVENENLYLYYSPPHISDFV